MNDFINQLLGRIPNQHTPVFEGGGINNPALANFLSDVFLLKNSIPNLIILSIFLILIIGLPILYYLLRVTLPGLSAEDRSSWAFAAGFILLTILMPRVKPYSLLILILPLYWLTKNENYFHRLVIIGLSIILPVGIYDFYLLYLHFRLDIPRLLGLLFDYGPTLSLVLSFILVLLLKTLKVSSFEGKKTFLSNQ